MYLSSSEWCANAYASATATTPPRSKLTNGEDDVFSRVVHACRITSVQEVVLLSSAISKVEKRLKALVAL